MAQTSAKKRRSKPKRHYDPNGKKIRAVQNYILGQPDITKGQALRDAGYSKSTSEKQPQIITDHPLYQEWKLAQATQVKVSKDFINLKYLALLSRKLKVFEELKVLEALAKVNGYWQKGDIIVPPVNGSTNYLGDVNVTNRIDFKDLSDGDLERLKKETVEGLAGEMGFRLIRLPANRN